MCNRTSLLSHSQLINLPLIAIWKIIVAKITQNSFENFPMQEINYAIFPREKKILMSFRSVLFKQGPDSLSEVPSS